MVGDLKTFDLLVKVKREYCKAMDWVVPYPGDWHILKNLQEVIIKIYWDAGLKDIAKVIHSGSTHQSLQACSNFKRNHRFFLQVFEAFYLYSIDSFHQKQLGNSSVIDAERVFDEVKYIVLDYNPASNTHFFEMQQKFVSSQLDQVLISFSELIESECDKSKTFNF